jgi:MscS family membrane protein
LLARPPGATGVADTVRHAFIDERLPAFMVDVRFLGLALWQWVGALLLVLVAWGLARLVGAIVRRVLRPITERTSTPLDDRILEAVFPPGRLLLGIGLFAAGSAVLALPLSAWLLLGRIEVVLAVVAATWMSLRLVDVAVRSIGERLDEMGKSAAVSVLPLGGRAAKAFLIVVAMLAMLQNLGFNVTGLIAGLGVGGLAVALAAQKTLANLFGGVSLVADQPVRVGDFCKYGDGKIGTVEEIGLRSTRVRTLDRTLVTIPNAEFSEVQIENYAVRDRLRLFVVLGLRYETSPDQIRHVIAEIRKLLVAHPMVTDSPARIRFIGFGPHSLDLEVFAYVGTGDWNEFLQVREDIFLRIMDIVRESGTGFAFPSQTLYLGRDGGLDEARARRAEEEVRLWRERNALPIPDYPEDELARLANTLDYPPRESALAGPEGDGDQDPPPEEPARS